MRVIAASTLKSFWEQPEHQDAEQALKAWHEEATKAIWQQPSDIKAHYRNASILKNRRVVFNIKGNDFRLVTRINYEFKLVWIRFIGTHEEYDKIDATKI